jgi:F420-non-reducing hydrogenase iron-sulfur subunit
LQAAGASMLADLDGASRIGYPPNLRVVPLMCGSTVDLVFVLKSLLEGADGTLVGGCDYEDGGYRAQ